MKNKEREKIIKEFYKHFVSGKENLSSVWLGSFERWLFDKIETNERDTL